jgi:hypothetical protein
MTGRYCQTHLRDRSWPRSFNTNLHVLAWFSLANLNVSDLVSVLAQVRVQFPKVSPLIPSFDCLASRGQGGMEELPRHLEREAENHLVLMDATA